jgi:choline dehydrogenase-like flavoprotein
VLDTNCKAHELDNLYVVDPSFFVSIGAVNPSLTALRMRCAWAITYCRGCRKQAAALMTGMR